MHICIKCTMHTHAREKKHKILYDHAHTYRHTHINIEKWLFRLDWVWFYFPSFDQNQHTLWILFTRLMPKLKKNQQHQQRNIDIVKVNVTTKNITWFSSIRTKNFYGRSQFHSLSCFVLFCCWCCFSFKCWFFCLHSAIFVRYGRFVTQMIT